MEEHAVKQQRDLKKTLHSVCVAHPFRGKGKPEKQHHIVNIFFIPYSVHLDPDHGNFSCHWDSDDSNPQSDQIVLHNQFAVAHVAQTQAQIYTEAGLCVLLSPLFTR